MVKLKSSPKNLELDINVAKNGQFRVFPRKAANYGKRQIPWRGVKIRMPRNTAGPDNDYLKEHGKLQNVSN